MDRIALSQDQQQTRKLVSQLMGEEIAARYEDWCLLSSAETSLHVPAPIAAHAMRELESILRQSLMPFEARPEIPPDVLDRISKACSALKELGFSAEEVARATRPLQPATHAAQISRIAQNLRLPIDGEVVRAWINLSKAQSASAHKRSFHVGQASRSDFGATIARPFELVLREVLRALERRFDVLLGRVDEIVAMDNKAEAVKLFLKEIPGSIPLQRRFFERISGASWLKPLIESGVFSGGSRTYGEAPYPWIPGDYLVRLASDGDEKARTTISELLRQLAGIADPEMCERCVEIVHALPEKDGSALDDVVISWIQSGSNGWYIRRAVGLVKRLATAGYGGAAIRIASALFAIVDNDGKIESRFRNHHYGYELSRISPVLIAADGHLAFSLFRDLLIAAGEISKRMSVELQDDHSGMWYPEIAKGEVNHYDIFGTLIRLTRDAAVHCATKNSVARSSIAQELESLAFPIFRRIALHVLSKNPLEAPKESTQSLLNPEFIGAKWCEDEYAALALAYFPSMSPQDKHQLLTSIEEVPSLHTERWKGRFYENNNRDPNEEELADFSRAVKFEALRLWRSVLPPDKLVEIEALAVEFGERQPAGFRLQPSRSAMSAAEIVAMPVDELAQVLRVWSEDPDNPLITTTALAQELRAAVEMDPERFSARADVIFDLRPRFVRSFIEGLRSAASDKKEIEWQSILDLLDLVVCRIDEPIGVDDQRNGEDPSWLWACFASAELLATGLLHGLPAALPIDKADRAWALIEKLLSIETTDTKDFEKNCKDGIYFAATQTLRGISTVAVLRFAIWYAHRSAAQSVTVVHLGFDSVPNVSQIIDNMLAGESPASRISRGVLGKSLGTLFYFDEVWTAGHLTRILPSDEESKSSHLITWTAHLQDGSINSAAFRHLQSEYRRSIEAWSGEPDTGEEDDTLGKRLGEHLVGFYFNGDDPLRSGLLAQYLDLASPTLRKHAMEAARFNVETSVGKSDRAVIVEKGTAYFDFRMTAMHAADSLVPFRSEFSAFSFWLEIEAVDTAWKAETLGQLLQSGVVPEDSWLAVEWISANLERVGVHLAISCLDLLLTGEDAETWTATTTRDDTRRIIAAALRTGSNTDNLLARDLVAKLEARNQSGFLDLLTDGTNQNGRGG